MASRFIGYGPWRGNIVSRSRGSVVSIETGPATAYALEGLQERCVIFVDPTERTYAGQIVGENSRNMDITCNPTKRKHLTNHRSSTKDIGVKLDVPRKMTLEQAMEWIRDDELVEITPRTMRIRKAVLDTPMNEDVARRNSWPWMKAPIRYTQDLSHSRLTNHR
jgi:GTP-binding protein